MDDKAMRDHLFLMQRNVAQGADTIAWQKQVIGQMTRAGRDTRKQKKLLSNVQETHSRNLSYRDRLVSEVAHTESKIKPKD